MCDTKNKAEKFIYELDGRLYINLTNECCNDCEFCLRRNGDGIKGDTLWLKREPTAKEVIALIKSTDIKFDEAVFCGYGESTYRVDAMTEIADFLHSIGKKTRLNTNGLGNAINNRDIVPLLKGRIDTVSVSLNESDKVRYNAICHPVFGEDAYGYLLDFTEKCVKSGINTVLTVVDVIPEAEIEKCRLEAQKIGARLRVRKHIKNNESYE